MKVVWTRAALADRDDIWLNIAENSVSAAIKMDDRFSLSAETLRGFPQAGRKGTVGGTRELMAHRNYRLVYRIDADMILIVALVHVARQWPPVRLDDT